VLPRLASQPAAELHGARSPTASLQSRGQQLCVSRLSAGTDPSTPVDSRDRALRRYRGRRRYHLRGKPISKVAVPDAYAATVAITVREQLAREIRAAERAHASPSEARGVRDREHVVVLVAQSR